MRWLIGVEIKALADSYFTPMRFPSTCNIGLPSVVLVKKYSIPIHRQSRTVSKAPFAPKEIVDPGNYSQVLFIKFERPYLCHPHLLQLLRENVISNPRNHSSKLSNTVVHLPETIPIPWVWLSMC